MADQPARKQAAPVFVAKDEQVWRWSCRQCQVSDWALRHSDAVTHGVHHVSQHARFGFRKTR